MTSTTTPAQAPTSSTNAHPAIKLLNRAHPIGQANQIFTTKIRTKPLLLTPSTSTADDKRALRRKIRDHKRRYHLQHRKPRPLSAREKRTLQIHALKDDEVKYEIYKGLNEMWTGYILEVLGFMRDGKVVPDAARKTVGPAGHGSLIASADFHGMEVEVVRCGDVGRVGLRGIVVRETKNTLVVVTAKDQVRRILKRGAVFRVVLELPAGGDESVAVDKVEGEAERDGRKVVFDLHGSQLEVRPVERAVKKFKWRPMAYM